MWSPIPSERSLFALLAHFLSSFLTVNISTKVNLYRDYYRRIPSSSENKFIGKININLSDFLRMTNIFRVKMTIREKMSPQITSIVAKKKLFVIQVELSSSNFLIRGNQISQNLYSFSRVHVNQPDIWFSSYNQLLKGLVIFYLNWRIIFQLYECIKWI